MAAMGMRTASVAWPRWAFYIILASLLMWVVTAFEPDGAQLEQVCLSKVVRQTIDGAFSSQGSPVTIGRLDTRDVTPACAKQAMQLLEKHVRVQPGAPGHLTVYCERIGAQVSAKITGEIPGSEQPTSIQNKTEALVPNSFSLLPPLAAVLLALMLRKILIALLLAIFWGALLLTDFRIWEAVEKTSVDYIWNVTTDSWNLYVFGFTLALMGMVHVSIASGGMQGIIRKVASLAKTVRMTQVATALMGVAVFFDDYANSVVVGSAARPLTDAQRISREKLAYIVDSTAAPIAGIAIISTWIGIELSYFEGQMSYIRPLADNAYDLFFQIMPYRFYCIFALALVFIIAISGRDFGPMLKAERRARLTGRVAPKDALTVRGQVLTDTVMKDNAPARWWNGLLPIATVIIGSFIAFCVIGADTLFRERGFEVSWTNPKDLVEAFKAVDDNNVVVLFWAAMGGALVAILLSLSQRILSVSEALIAFFRGVMAMLPALALLILAIGIRDVTKELETASFLVASLEGVSALVLPLITFLLAAIVAFATGTSWGTMGILLPVAIPLAAELTGTQGADPLVILLVTGSILDGAIFGDHCSLISDTTVMTSMACSCDHISHVKTQMPYATLAMVAAGGFGYLFSAHLPESSVLLSYGLGLTLMLGFVLWRGKRIDTPRPTDS